MNRDRVLQQLDEDVLRDDDRFEQKNCLHRHHISQNEIESAKEVAERTVDVENDRGKLNEENEEDQVPADGGDQLVDQGPEVVVLFEPDDPVDERNGENGSEYRDQDGHSFDGSVLEDCFEANFFCLVFNV